MGTHPIFESDFDCLTEWRRARQGHVRVRDRSQSRVLENVRAAEATPEAAQDLVLIPAADRVLAPFSDTTTDLIPRISKYDLEREFDRYGRVLDLILIRRCPTVCFIVYKYGKDARYAAKKLHNMSIWNTRLRAELAKPSGKNPRRRSRSRERRRSRSRSRGNRGRRSRSRSRRRSRSRSHSRSRRNGSARRGSTRRNRSDSRNRSRTKSRSRSR